MTVHTLHGDAAAVLRTLPAASFQCCVTSPPYYGLRSYLPAGHPDKSLEIGQEATPDEFVARVVGVFAEVRRALRNDGVLWLNVGDSYASTSTYNAAREHVLSLRNKRATAAELTLELVRMNVITNADQNTVRAVASYLSTSKERFNNIRGEGYGLATWSLAAPEFDTAAESLPLADAAARNEGSSSAGPFAEGEASE